MRLRICFLVSSLLISACSQGESTHPVVPVAKPSPVATLSAAIATTYGIPQSAGTPRAIVLGNGLFLEPFLPFATAALTFAPASSQTPAVTWSLNNPDVTLTPPADSIAPSPPPGGVTMTGVTYGVSTLTAHYGTAASQTYSIPIFYYPSADVGCDFRAEAGAAFDPSAMPSPNASQDDMYGTSAVQSGLNPCGFGTGYETAAGSQSLLHFPYGATIVTDGSDPTRAAPPGIRQADAFPFQASALWRNDFTSISEQMLDADLNPCPNASSCTTIPASVLLFKTAGGRIVKFDIVSPSSSGDGIALMGVYEVSDTSGAFAY